MGVGAARDAVMGVASGQAHDRRGSGSVTVNALPRPGAEVTPTRPPCASTIAFTSDNPSPSPRAERLESPR